MHEKAISYKIIIIDLLKNKMKIIPCRLCYDTDIIKLQGLLVSEGSITLMVQNQAGVLTEAPIIAQLCWVNRAMLWKASLKTNCM